ncbi:hypothetical protein LA080_009518 [Diaporthe eres]|nr:hypothetical protein LA080_009518 [Diaporthe eres]
MLTKAILFSLLSSSTLAGVLNAANLGPRAADVCGKKGYHRGSSNYDYDGSGKFSTFADCSKRCLANSKCLSFGYGGKDLPGGGGLSKSWKLGILADKCAIFQCYMTELYEEEKSQARLKAGSISGASLKMLISSLVHASQGEAQNGSGLTESKIYSNTFMLNFIGHDNTIHTFTFAIYFLAANPAAQDWVSEEGAAAAPRQEDLINLQKGTFLGWSEGARDCPARKFSQVEFVATMAVS